MTSKLLELVHKLERWVALALVAILCVIVVLAAAEVAVRTVQDIAAPPMFFPGIDQLLDLFGRVLLVAIGIELVETLRGYASGGDVRVEVVVTVAMIAMARSVILLEPGHTAPGAAFGTAALLVALSIAYFVFVRPQRS
jgi:uncharacterized membrane protein (DUF373 family)